MQAQVEQQVSFARGMQDSAAPTEFLSVDLVAGEQEQHAEAEFAQDADRFAVSCDVEGERPDHCARDQ